jgi:hypothetical protein
MHTSSTTVSDLLTRVEAARYLRISPITLGKWSSSRRQPIPFVRVGRRAMYRVADLERFLADNRNE